MKEKEKFNDRQNPGVKSFLVSLIKTAASFVLKWAAGPVSMGISLGFQAVFSLGSQFFSFIKNFSLQAAGSSPKEQSLLQKIKSPEGMAFILVGGAFLLVLPLTMFSGQTVSSTFLATTALPSPTIPPQAPTLTPGESPVPTLTPSPSGNFDKNYSGPPLLKQYIKEVADNVNVPAGVLGAILLIEGTPLFKETDPIIDQYFRNDDPRAEIVKRFGFNNYNSCGAVGPLQFTTGGAHANCTDFGEQCPAKDWFCERDIYGNYTGNPKPNAPNQWAIYDDGLPDHATLLRQALYGAAKKILNDSGNKPPPWDMETVYRVATAYYGACREPITRVDIPGFENKTYCQFVWEYGGGE